MGFLSTAFDRASANYDVHRTKRQAAALVPLVMAGRGRHGKPRPSVTQRVGAACAIRALPDLCGGIVPGLSFTLRLSGCTELGGKCGVGQSVTTRTAKAALWQAPARR